MFLANIGFEGVRIVQQTHLTKNELIFLMAKVGQNIIDENLHALVEFLPVQENLQRVGQYRQWRSYVVETINFRSPVLVRSRTQLVIRLMGFSSSSL